MDYNLFCELMKQFIINEEANHPINMGLELENWTEYKHFQFNNSINEFSSFCVYLIETKDHVRIYANKNRNDTKNIKFFNK